MTSGILGERITLRPMEEADVPLVHRWMNHPEVWRYMDYEFPSSLADVSEDLERSRKEGFPLVIEVDGRPVGRAGLNRFSSRDRSCGFYMFIGEPAHWGHGLAGDAARTLVAYAFDRWDLHLVELWTLADNDRALAAYRRCGFVEEARLRERSFKDGRWVDHVVMSVTPEEFARAMEARAAGAPPGG